MMKLVIVCLALLAVVQAKSDPNGARDVIKKLLNRAGVPITDYQAHELDLGSQKNVLDLLQKYNLYDELISAFEKVDQLLIALKKESEPEGAKLGLVIAALRGLRHRLAAKANEDELRFVDSEIDLLSALRHDGQNALALAKAKAINSAGLLNLSDADIKHSFVYNILESYLSASKPDGRNPRQVVLASAKALSNIDVHHPLSSSLGQLLDALREQHKFVHEVNRSNSTEIAKEIRLLELAKGRQDDFLLDGLKGKALSIYEDLVENLKDLKKELNKLK